MITRNESFDGKLTVMAKKNGIDIPPIDAQTEEGKSLLDRMKGETALLESLQGDAFDKEYMTLVTNEQQNVINYLGKIKESARDPGVRQQLSDLTEVVQNRLKTAQDILAKLYANNI
jgi:predicted outer membrane protein